MLRLSRYPLIVAAALHSIAHAAGLTATAAPSPVLASGMQLTDSFAGLQDRSYRIDIKANQFVLIAVKPVAGAAPRFAIRVTPPSGPELPERSEFSETEGDQIPVVALRDGAFVLTMEPIGKHPQNRQYAVSVSVARVATPDDRTQASAFEKYATAQELSARGGPENQLSAIKNLVESRDLYKRAGNATMLARALLDLGDLYTSDHKYDQARTCYNAALGIKENLPPHWKAYVLESLANLDLVSGVDTLKAFDHLDEALAIYKKAALTAPAARVLNQIGLTYQEFGDNERGQVYLRQARATLQGQDRPALLGTILNNLGLGALANHRTSEAIADLQEASKLRSDPSDRAQSLSNLALALDQNHEPDRARKSLLEVLKVYESLHNPEDTGRVLVSLAGICGQLGDRTEEKQYLDRALKISITSDLGALEGYARSSLGRFYYEDGDLTAALENLERATSIDEQLRNVVVQGDIATNLFAEAAGDYRLLIDVLMQLNQRQPSGDFLARALAANEQIHARRFLDLATFNLSSSRTVLPEELVRARRAVTAQILTLSERGEASAPSRADRATLFTLLSRRAQLDTQANTLIGFSGTFNESHPYSADDIKDIVKTDRQSLLLEYALGKERSYLWAVDVDGITAYELPPQEEIDAAAVGLYATVSRNRADSEASTLTEKYGYYVKALSEMLLGPVSDRLKGRRLVIVPDGALRYLPFGALAAPAVKDDPDATPLVVTNEIVYEPSLSALLKLRRRPEACAVDQHGIMVVADPVLGSNDPRIQSYHSVLAHQLANGRVEDQASSDRLLYSAEEAASIAGEYDERAVFLASGFKATRSLLVGPVPRRYSILHLATHTFVDDARPELSKITLSAYDPAGRPQAHSLFAFELANLNLPRDLVVLSSCEGTIGRSVDGEGLLSVTRAFMASGTRRIIGSLWNVDGEATSELMARFYHELEFHGASPPAALRAAQIWMYSQRHTRDPYNWAAFILNGEWAGLTPGSEQGAENDDSSSTLSAIESDIAKSNSPLLSRDDLMKDPISVLEGKSPVAERILNRITDRLKREPGNSRPDPMPTLIVDELNKLVLSGDTELSLFKGLDASTNGPPEALSDDQRFMRRNRRFLEQTYPTSISARISPGIDFRPSIPSERIGWFKDNACLRDVSNLSSSPDSAATRLDKLVSSGPYACRSHWSDLTKDVTWQCRFLSEIDFSSRPVSSVIEYIPTSWQRILNTEQMQKLWVEATIPVDAAGFPIADARIERPVALRTDSGTYLVQEIEPPKAEGGIFGSGGFYLEHPKFEITSASDTRPIIAAAMQAYIEEFKATFARPPFRAAAVEDPNLPAGEAEVRSTGQPSEIVPGGRLESVTYSLAWRASNGGFVLISEYLCGKGQRLCSGRKAFIDVTVTAYSRRGSDSHYRSASSKELTLYESKVNAALVEVLSRSCRRVGGTLAQSVCKL